MSLPTKPAGLFTHSHFSRVSTNSLPESPAYSCCAQADAGTAGTAHSGDGRDGAAVLRLDKRTHLDREEGRYSAYIRDYGGGLVEVGWAFIGSQAPQKAAKGKSENSLLHADRAARRARSRLRQLTLASGCDHLVTLTYRENLTDFQRASEDFGRFVRLVRRASPNWVYVAVAEEQKRGAWHWHLAVVGRQDVNRLRSAWRQIVGEGNIDVQPPPRGRTNRRLAIVGYLSKYLGKTFTEERQLNRRRFRASHGIKVPLQSLSIPIAERGDASVYVLDQLRAQAGSVGHVWLDTRMGAGWACSWE